MRTPSADSVDTRWRTRIFPFREDTASRADAVRLFASPSRLRRLLERVAPLRLPVLLHGEPGRGKTWAARALHALSGRVGDAVETEPCGGPAMGGPLSAIWDRARHGTLIVRGVERVGTGQQAEIGGLLDDAAGGAAMVLLLDGEPEASVTEGRLRRDLLDRSLTVEVEPLRRRTGDVIPALEVFLSLAAAAAGRPAPAVHELTRVRLQAYCWPGDYAELERFAERAVVLDSVEEALTMLGSEARLGASDEELWEAACAGIDEGRPVSLERVRRRIVRRAESAWIERVMQGVRGDAQRAAELLGLSPSDLESRLRGVRS